MLRKEKRKQKRIANDFKRKGTSLVGKKKFLKKRNKKNPENHLCYLYNKDCHIWKFYVLKSGDSTYFHFKKILIKEID